MAKLKEILKVIDGVAPFQIAEKWDNSGLQAGFPNSDVTKIITALDVTMPLMEAARDIKADLVLTHHPLIMTPGKNFDFEQMPGSAICMAAMEKINIVSVHTNLDKADQGLNDYFGQIIGVDISQIFVPDQNLESDNDEIIGIGRIGNFKKPMPLKDIAQTIKDNLGIQYLRVTGEMDRIVQSAAICTGSGGSLIDQFIKSRADVYVTGDIKYHEARQVEEAGKSLIDVGHFGSEYIAIELLQRLLSPAIKAAGLDIEIITYLNEKDPFTIV